MINIYSKWFGYSILGILFVCIVDLGRKYVLDKNMIQVDEMIIYLAMFAGILGFLHFISDKKCRNPRKIPNKSLFSYWHFRYMRLIFLLQDLFTTHQMLLGLLL